MTGTESLGSSFQSFESHCVIAPPNCRPDLGNEALNSIPWSIVALIFSVSSLVHSLGSSPVVEPEPAVLVSSTTTSTFQALPSFGASITSQVIPLPNNSHIVQSLSGLSKAVSNCDRNIPDALSQLNSPHTAPFQIDSPWGSLVSL